MKATSLDAAIAAGWWGGEKASAPAPRARLFVRLVGAVLWEVMETVNLDCGCVVPAPSSPGTVGCSGAARASGSLFIVVHLVSSGSVEGIFELLPLITNVLAFKGTEASDSWEPGGLPGFPVLRKEQNAEHGDREERGFSVHTCVGPEATAAVDTPSSPCEHPQLSTPHCSFPRGVTDSDVDDLGSRLKLLPLCVQNSDVADPRRLARGAH